MTPGSDDRETKLSTRKVSPTNKNKKVEVDLSFFKLFQFIVKFVNPTFYFSFILIYFLTYYTKY